MNLIKEYDACYQVVKECVPHENVNYNPPDADTFSEPPSASSHSNLTNRARTIDDINVAVAYDET